MKYLAAEIEAALTVLVGLRLSLASYAGMRVFGFGQTRKVDRGMVAEYSLHLQCPWRLTLASNLICGSSDWYMPENEDDFAKLADDSWDPGRDGNLQQASLARLFENTRSGPVPQRMPLENETSNLVVTDVDVDEIGGFTLLLSPGYALSAFPAGSRGEHWRLFEPGSERPHFVMESASASDS